MSRNFVSQRTVNAIIGGIFSKARENKINKENEEKLSNIENLFNSVISCENKQDIETILGTGNVEKILKDSYIVFYNFSELEKDKEHITTCDFTSYYGTNWCGHDDLIRTCDILNISIKDDDVIYLDKPLVFTGVDDDMGHEYPWRFEVDSIVEVRAKGN